MPFFGSNDPGSIEMAGRYHFKGQAPETPPEYQRASIWGIGAEGVAGSYAFQAFTAIS